ncbi:MAG TPA: TolC family protein [Bacteroidales bacterium]|jgi:outer membrane protein|nr:TolC family protein [Bacteroidales bacterium]
MKNLFLSIFIAVLLPGNPMNAQEDNVWSLEECISYALEKNIQVRKSELANQRNQYYADQAKAQRFPSLNASLNHNFSWSKSDGEGQTGYSGINGSNVSVNSGVTLFNASRITNQIKQADLDLQAGQYSLETVRESVSLSILEAYLQVLYAEEQVKNSIRQIESTSGQVDLAAERLAVQLISQADYAQVKAQLASEKLTLANSENQLAIAKVNLEQLMELPVSESFAIVHPEFGEQVNQHRLPDVMLIYEMALGIKPQVKAAEVSRQIASLDEKIARAGYFPTLSASAGIGTSYSSRLTDPYFSQLDKGLSPSLGFSLTIPVYQKKQVRTGVAVAKAGYRDAELNEIDTRNGLRKNIEQACVDVTSAQVKYEASLEKYNATEVSAALSDEKFRQGLINSVDYLVSKTSLIVAESELLQARYNLIFSYKVLDFYQGVPLVL